MHQSLLNTSLQIFTDTSLNNQLKGIPFVHNPEFIRKYLAPPPATPKGRMKRLRAGIRSTRKKVTSHKRNEVRNRVFWKRNRRRRDTHHHSSTVNRPKLWTRSRQTPNKQHFLLCWPCQQTSRYFVHWCNWRNPNHVAGRHAIFFVAYDYDTNFIFAIPIANVKDATIVKAFDQLFTKLTEKGHKPAFNITDNQAVNPLKTYLKSKNCRWQFVEPTNHQVKAAEWAIQTYKNQFISGLRSMDSEWTLTLWDQLAHQAATTLNILQKSRIEQKKTSYHQLHGHKYDWNAFTMASPDMRAVIYLDPDSRTSWLEWGIDTWYCGPSLDHYRNCIFYVPKTRSYRISGSFDLFTQHWSLP